MYIIRSQEQVAEQAAEGPDLVALSLADLDELADLESRCFDPAWTGAQLRGAFESDFFSAFGLRGPAGLVAYMSFYHVVPEMEILNLAVRPDCRGLGYGTLLAGLVLDIGRHIGLTRAFLEVRPTNDPALRLYRSLGFRQIGVRPGYYSDKAEEALLMARDL